MDEGMIAAGALSAMTESDQVTAIGPATVQEFRKRIVRGQDRTRVASLDLRRTLACGYGLRGTGWISGTDLRIRRLGVRIPPSALPRPQVRALITQSLDRDLCHLAGFWPDQRCLRRRPLTLIFPGKTSAPIRRTGMDRGDASAAFSSSSEDEPGSAVY